MSEKVQLRLIQSRTMSDKDEHDVIRFPKRAREHFGFANDMVALGKGEYQTNLKVKRAYRADVRRLATMIQKDSLTDEAAVSVGFVTQTVQRRINRKDGGVWVSDGIGSITIGADPEFGLIGPEEMLVRGSNVVPHQGSFGSDGPGVEVRPSPDTNHLAVVEKVGEILRNPPAEADKYKWLGGATYRDSHRTYWFGGHIHLGRPTQIKADDAAGVYQRIATALDCLLALPMCRFDTPNPHKRRNGCRYSYGKAGDIRTDYPERDRFEYRVLSGLWVVHPSLAKIVMGAAKCITETAYGRIANKKFDLEWAKGAASRKSLLQTFKLKDLRETQSIINNAVPDDVTPEHIKVWKRQICELDSFDEYSAEMNALIALAEAGPINFNLDIKANWQGNKPMLSKREAGTKLHNALRKVEEGVE